MFGSSRYVLQLHYKMLIRLRAKAARVQAKTLSGLVNDNKVGSTKATYACE